MTTAYVVHHVHPLEDDEDVKLIGVYSTEPRAQEAIARLRLQPGFCDCPDGFTINPYQLDEDHWTEGYVTIDPNSESCPDENCS